MAGKRRTPVQVGTRWGSLTVVKLLRKNESSQVLWEVKCDCGQKTYCWGYNLVKGKKTSCGCGRLPANNGEKMTNPPSDEVMTAIVRRARCGRCDGKGFRLVPSEDHRGERISGEMDKIDCPDCDANGIKLGLCRRLAVELGGGPNADQADVLRL